MTSNITTKRPFKEL